jgi:hypothetical protein
LPLLEGGEVAGFFVRGAPSNHALRGMRLRAAAERVIVGRAVWMHPTPVRVVLVVGMLVLESACDPGWGYHVSDSRLGAANSPARSEEIALVARGGLATSMLSVEIDVTNNGSGLLAVREGPFRVLDALNRPLPWYWGGPPARACENRGEKVVTLDRAQVCSTRGDFKVNPTAGPFGRRNTDLKTLTVVVDGLMRGNAPVPSSVTLDWN